MAKLSPFSKTLRRRCAWLGLLIGLLAFGLDRATPLFERAELATLDMRFRVRGARPPGRARGSLPRVALVTIDSKSLQALGRWPWSLRRHAELVRALRRAGVSLIVFDLLFTDRQNPADEVVFAAAIREAGNVLLAAAREGRGEEAAEAVGEERLLSAERMRVLAPPAPRLLPSWLPPPTPDLFWLLPTPRLLAAARGVGFVDLPADPDSVFRRAWLLRPVDNGRLYPHLALLAAAHALGVPPARIRPEAAPAVSLGSRRVPLDADGAFLIDFVGPPPAPGIRPLFPRVSYADVLTADGDLSSLRGRIVFVGVTAPGIFDHLAGPYSALNPGLETNASLLNAVLEERYFRRPDAWFPLILLGGMGWLLGRTVAVRTTRRGAGLVGIAGIVYVVAACLAFSAGRILLPLAAPLAGLVACYAAVTALRMGAESRESARRGTTFGRYVSPRVAAHVLDTPEGQALGGQRVEASVLFCDIRDFTPLSEKSTPEEVIAMVNDYLARMMPIVERHDGTLLRLAGDEILAVWGAPYPQPDHAMRAVRAAREMLGGLGELNADRSARGLPQIDIGIGVNSGEIVVGNLGTDARTQFDLMGDVVNTAKRIEQLNKDLGTRLLIGAETHAQLAGQVAAREQPPVRVKGKAEALTVYEVAPEALA